MHSLQRSRAERRFSPESKSESETFEEVSQEIFWTFESVNSRKSNSLFGTDPNPHGHAERLSGVSGPLPPAGRKQSSPQQVQLSRKSGKLLLVEASE